MKQCASARLHEIRFVAPVPLLASKQWHRSVICLRPLRPLCPFRPFRPFVFATTPIHFGQVGKPVLPFHFVLDRFKRRLRCGRA